MTTDSLDELDFGILHLLQQDARHVSPVDMEKRLPVTDTTIRNRIAKMEEDGIIEGYAPILDYDRAGFQLRVKFSCTAPMRERERMAREAHTLPNVVHVEELLSARENVQIMVVTSEFDELHEVTSRIDEMGLTIERENLVRSSYNRPFDHFGESNVADEE